MLEAKDEIWESVARSSGILRMYKKLPGGLLTTQVRAYMIQAPTGSRSKHVGASTRYSNLIIYAKTWARQRGVEIQIRERTPSSTVSSTLTLFPNQRHSPVSVRKVCSNLKLCDCHSHGVWLLIIYSMIHVVWKRIQ